MEISETWKDSLYEVSDALISMQEIGMDYSNGADPVSAIEDINLNIFPGEFVCVMGASGCGKSTLLKILAGFLKPTKGKIKLNDVEIQGTDWHRGVVFQHPPLFEWFSVRQNIAFGPKMRKVSKQKIKKDVEKYLVKVGLKEFADKRVFELSGGMKQRVAIARALINEPEILLMDEPFGALDALTREKMQNLIRKIWWDTGKTIFFITHDVDEALLLGTRVIVLSKHPGSIVEEIPINFTNQLIEEGSDHARFTETYYQYRQKILSRISEQ